MRYQIYIHETKAKCKKKTTENCLLENDYSYHQKPMKTSNRLCIGFLIMKFMVDNSRLRVVTLSLSFIERDAKYSPARTRAAILTRVAFASRSTDEAKEGHQQLLRMTDFRYITV